MTSSVWPAMRAGMPREKSGDVAKAVVDREVVIGHGRSPFETTARRQRVVWAGPNQPWRRGTPFSLGLHDSTTRSGDKLSPRRLVVRRVCQSGFYTRVYLHRCARSAKG